MSRWSLFFIIIFLAVPQMGIDLYLPSAPSMVLALHTSKTMIQLSLAIYIVGVGLSQLFYGPISDGIGRKPVVLFGSIVFIIGSSLCCVAGNIHLFLLGRLIQGLGIGFGAALSRAILRDLCHDKLRMAKIVSYQSMTWSMIPLLAPIIGGYVEHFFYWRTNFYILLMMGVIVFLLTLFKLNESHSIEKRSQLNLMGALRTYFFIVSHFRVFVYILIIAIQFSGVLTIVQLAPFIFQNQLGYSAATYGWLIFVVGFGSFLGAFLNRNISQRFPLDRIIITAITFSLIVAVIMNLLSLHWFNVWVMVIPIFIIRVAGGLTYSNCITQGMHVYPEISGSVGAFFGVVAMIGSSSISAVVAHLPHYKQFSLTGSIAVQLLASLILFSVALLYKKDAFRDNHPAVSSD